MPVKRAKRERPSVDRMDEIVSLRHAAGSDGTNEVRLQIDKAIGALRGYGHDKRSAARHLVDQLRLIADYVAHVNGLHVHEPIELANAYEVRNGVPLPGAARDPQIVTRQRWDDFPARQRSEFLDNLYGAARHLAERIPMTEDDRQNIGQIVREAARDRLSPRKDRG